MAAEPETMSRRAQPVDAIDVARDFVSTANSFADTFVQHISPDDAAVSPAELQRRRRRVCAAVWAAIVATFEASALTDQEKARILPVVRQEMLAAWNKHCVVDPSAQEEIIDRARLFLRNHDRSSPLRTATAIMKDLLDSIDPKAVQTFTTKRLAALLAHHMLEDLRRLNEIKSTHSIE